jgi:hypothetical protein
MLVHEGLQAGPQGSGLLGVLEGQHGQLDEEVEAGSSSAGITACQPRGRVAVPSATVPELPLILRKAGPATADSPVSDFAPMLARDAS